MTTNRNAHESLYAKLAARWPEQRVAPSLNRVRAALELLGDPQRSAPVIHIGGTNGKGSTAIMIESLLRAAGLRTGRFSSPHLVDVTERIAIDGLPISQERFAEIWNDVEPIIELVDAQQLASDGQDGPGVAMTFFEVLTVMAFAAFADAPVDVAVVEVGLGGAWDATNVADGQVAVMMPIDLDHTHLLGETVAEIATEKAGIIKPGASAILAGQQPEAAEILLARCASVGAVAHREGIDFGLLDRRLAVGGQLIRLNAADGPVSDIHLPLHGVHMARNAGVALAAVEAFLGDRGLSEEVVREGFADLVVPARLETVRQSPPIVLDTAHNPHAAAASAEAIAEAYAFNPLVGVVAMMRDKDVESVLQTWEPLMNAIVCTQVDTERCLGAEELAEIAVGIFGFERVHLRPKLADAIEWATTLADVEAGQPGVLVTGSVIAVGEARGLLVGAETSGPGAVRVSEDVDWEADDHGGDLDELGHLIEGGADGADLDDVGSDDDHDRFADQ